MIKPWIFEFLHGLEANNELVEPKEITAVFDEGLKLWQLVEDLGFEGVFFWILCQKGSQARH